jgi:hypothetical protein
MVVLPFAGRAEILERQAHFLNTLLCFLGDRAGSFMPLLALFHSETFTPCASSLARLALKYLR